MPDRSPSELEPSDLEHPSRDELQRFVLGDLPAGETDRVLQHLVQGCEPCRAVTASLWSIGTSPEEHPVASSVEYQPAVDRVFSAARRARAELEASRRESERLAAELASLQRAERLARAGSDPRYRSWAFCDLLLRRSRENAADPRRAAALAETAVAVAAGLEPGDCCPLAVIEDLRAAAWGALARARGQLADFAGAEAALRAARGHLAAGTGGGLEKARLLGLEAGLREAQGDSVEASRLRRRAEALQLPFAPARPNG
ncbi:MAG TPA: hypothetical protein VKK31_14565 [Thermoanaerobaculia bacterium]|nr:hypothetical protein [Thermoanaerobaculia bacterium]